MKKIIAPAAVILVIIGMLWLKSSRDSAYIRFVESLYQQCQADNRTEAARRQANIARLEAAQKEAAVLYLAQLDEMKDEADRKIKSQAWKSNEQLRQAKASSAEILEEKRKAEAALGEMTVCRGQLIVAAHEREKAIETERLQLKAEHEALLAAKQRELDTCEKARKAALGESVRRTWLSIGPSSQIFLQDGTIKHRLGISIQIPIIEIKSPFKRF